MKNEILVSPARLEELVQNGQCTLVDCRYDFSNTQGGRAAWLAGHIPGAGYAHLDDDLAAPVEAHTGRHPLPDATHFAAFLASTGWSKNRLLVAYDDGSNAISARLWWMMRYFGQSAALLDGGLAAWIESGRPLETGAPEVKPSSLESLEPDPRLTVSSTVLYEHLESPEWVVLDARSRERYSGQAEHLDTKAGHIPGALNRPFGENLDASGRFSSPERLKAQFQAVLGAGNTGKVVHSCGSGVTACHNLFAMELAGLGLTRLYPGSWSEWIRDPERPIRTGMMP
jgi:thiosulfate/3-mercaptopyruvate sulfurtransferase